MTGQCVVVTGAAAGIGRAAAKAFGKRGCRIALLARGVDDLEGARREVEEAGGKALVIPTDVADHDQVEAATARVEEEFGPIDVWVNDAMATIFCPFERISPEDFERATRVTYLGTVWGTMAALRRRKSRDRGTIPGFASQSCVRRRRPSCARGFPLVRNVDEISKAYILDLDCHYPAHNTY